jgi:hypothetical protein
LSSPRMYTSPYLSLSSCHVAPHGCLPNGRLITEHCACAQIEGQIQHDKFEVVASDVVLARGCADTFKRGLCRLHLCCLRVVVDAATSRLSTEDATVPPPPPSRGSKRNRQLPRRRLPVEQDPSALGGETRVVSKYGICQPDLVCREACLAFHGEASIASRGGTFRLYRLINQPRPRCRAVPQRAVQNRRPMQQPCTPPPCHQRTPSVLSSAGDAFTHSKERGSFH